MSRTVMCLGVLALAAVGWTANIATSAQEAPGASGSKLRASAEVAGAAPASFRFQKPSLDRPEAAPGAPIRLTASDGTGLTLVALEADAVLEPPLALTELRLTFDNPRDEVIEGRFQITLPPGAAISRFAMKIGGAWQEGEVVERQRARQTYEDFLHRRQDPALLEQEAGSQFSARVFPIPARGRKELIVSWSHALVRADEPYVLPLLGLAEIGRLDVRVLLGDRASSSGKTGAASNLGGEVRERRMVELQRRDWTPDRDFVVGQDHAAGRAGLRHGNLAVLRVAPPVEAAPQEIDGLYVLIDSSASRALGYTAQLTRLVELLAGLRDGAGRDTPVGLATFDQEVAPIFEGEAGDLGAEEMERLAERRPLGASDLHQALTWLGERLGEAEKRERGRYPRVLLLTDGVATAGETEGRALQAAVRALGARGVERLDVLAVGGLRDDATLRALTTGNLKHDGQRLDGDAPLAEIARRLTLASRSGIKVEVEGAAWVWPETLDGMQPGDQALVYADVPEGRPLRLALGGRRVELDGEVVPAERPLLQRSWAQARIERLLRLRETAFADDEDLRRALVHEVTALSVRHRVLSPYTALLVLETEADYQRFGLERRALADILTVGAGGLEVLDRTGPVRSGGPDMPVVSKPDFDARDAQERGDFAAAEPEAAEAVAVDVEEGVEGGVAGGVVGGVAGGTVGGTPGGVMRGTVAGVPPSAPAPAPRQQPREEAAMADEAEAPLRVSGNEVQRRSDAARVVEEKRARAEALTGRFGEVMGHLATGRTARARDLAESWIAEAPGDVLALLAAGEVWEAAGERSEAARAYGSLIDLFPGRADMRRLAGERLERLGEAGMRLAIDTYQKAVLDRPDHPTGHRLLAWALLRAGRFAEAFAALEQGLGQKYPSGRFAGADRVLREDLGLLAAAWLSEEPSRRGDVLDRLRVFDARLEDEPSLRFVLTWETDANDVDLHIWDRQGAHASYSNPRLPSGGELYADVTTGFGPETFVVRGAMDKTWDRKAAPYKLQAHYYRRGPMGYGMGILQVVAHDGRGGITVEPRPFVVMSDDALVELGEVGRGKGR